MLSCGRKAPNVYDSKLIADTGYRRLDERPEVGKYFQITAWHWYCIIFEPS